MADHFVHACAHALGVVLIVERARVCTAGDAQVVHINVDVIGGDAGLDHLAGQTQHLGCRGASVAHARNDVGRLHCWFGSTLDLTRFGIWGSTNMVGHATHGAYHAGQHAAFKGLMTALVFATAPTPAQFISGWQHGGWLRCGTHNERLWGGVGQLAVAP